MTTIQALPQPLTPANQSFGPLNLATLPQKTNQGIAAAKPQLSSNDLVIVGQSCPNDAPTTALSNPLDNFNFDIDLDFDFSGIYSNGGTPATETDVEDVAEQVSTSPALLEESIVKFAKVEPQVWNTANIGAFVQAVLRESYMLQSEQLLDFANKVKHCNLQRKGMREHLSKLRELKTAIGPVSEEQAATTSLNGSLIQGSLNSVLPSAFDTQPVLSETKTTYIQATIHNIKSHKSSDGETTLETRMLTVDGYRDNVIAAIPHMTAQEMWHLVHALGGEDFKVADGLSDIWNKIVDAMTPDQLVEMSATRASSETLQACNGTDVIKTQLSTSVVSGYGVTEIKSTPRNLLNHCCELSRVAANRYQTIRDYAHVELENLGINASTDSPESLSIALEKLEVYKLSLQEDVSAGKDSDEHETTTQVGQHTISPENGFVDAVTITDLSPDLVADGTKIHTVAQLDDEIEKIEDLLNSVGEDAQMANLDLQNALQKQQQLLQMMSNISKMLHETAMSIIRKIGS